MQSETIRVSQEEAEAIARKAPQTKRKSNRAMRRAFYFALTRQPNYNRPLHSRRKAKKEHARKKRIRRGGRS